jgi:hypothetical protein
LYVAFAHPFARILLIFVFLVLMCAVLLQSFVECARISNPSREDGGSAALVETPGITDDLSLNSQDNVSVTIPMWELIVLTVCGFLVGFLVAALFYWKWHESISDAQRFSTTRLARETYIRVDNRPKTTSNCAIL